MASPSAPSPRPVEGVTEEQVEMMRTWLDSEREYTPALYEYEAAALAALLSEVERLRADEGIIRGTWVCERCEFIQQVTAINPATGASGAMSVVDADRLVCPNDGTPLVAMTWKNDALSMRRAFDRQFAELMRLRAERAELDDDNATLDRIGQGLIRERDAARAERERYEKALRKFGNHKSGCDSWRNSPQDCDCGFRAALSASAPDTPTNEVPK